MEKLIIELLNKLGLGVNGVLAKNVGNCGSNFCSFCGSLNEFTNNKFGFKVEKSGADFVEFTSESEGIVLRYTYNAERGNIIKVEVHKM